jgi:hypothetical protein
MWSQFFFEIAHFAVSLFAALILFATFLLYFDAWQAKKTLSGFLRALGFFLLSLSYVVSSAILETSLLSVSVFNSGQMNFALLFLRNFGYGFILFELASEKLQKRPKEQLSLNAILISQISLPLLVIRLLAPFLALMVALFYTIKAMIGLEKHVKPAAGAFVLFAASELLAVSVLFRDTNNVQLYELFAAFGALWIIQHILLLLGSLILGHWVAGYLLKQFQPQLFMMFTTLILCIFLITTTVFTSVLLKNVQDETLNQLENDARVLRYALDSKRTEEIADVQAIAQNPEIQKNVIDKSRQRLGELAEQFLLHKKYSSLIIVDTNGQVIARGEDRDSTGTFLNDDPIVKRALMNLPSGGVTTTDGVLAPVVSLQAAAPIKNGDQIIGAALISTTIDNAFVDGIRSATGLQASLYGNNVLSATTLVAADGTTRLTGISENNPAITESVLVAGDQFKGSVNIGNTLYFAANLPLTDVDNAPIGMIFVGREQVGVLQTASRSIELTFLATAILLMISVIPSFLISRYITQQLK